MAIDRRKVRMAGKPQPRKRRTEDPVIELHRRFTAVMEVRLATVEEQTRTNYLTVMNSLTAKLEVPGKPLSEIIRELMSEAAPLLFAAMRG